MEKRFEISGLYKIELFFKIDRLLQETCDLEHLKQTIFLFYFQREK